MPRWCRLLLMMLVVSTLGQPAETFAQPPAPPAPAFDGTEPSPLLNEPTTPEEMFSAVLLMVDLARPDLANRYLTQFLASNPSDELLIQLRDKHGTAEFVKLSRIKELRGKALGLLDRLNAASKEQTEDPSYAETLIARLGSDPVKREQAVRELRNLGESAVPHLLRKLASPESEEQVDQIVMAISRIGQPAVAPTIAGLDAPEPAVRAAVIEALRLLKSPVAIPLLWHTAFAPNESSENSQAARTAIANILSASNQSARRVTADMAIEELRRMARGLYYGQYEVPVTDEGQAVLWTWNNDAGTVVRETMTPERGQQYLTLKFARQLWELSPDNPESQRLYLGSVLGWTVAEQGRERPIGLTPDAPGYTAMLSGEQNVTQVLADALAAGQSGTAQAALQILAQIGSNQMIYAGKGQSSPVLAALNYPDARVQFSAANALLRLEPDRPFRGAERVISILQRAITNAEESKALVVDADSERAELTSGYLADLGFTPLQARTGKEAFKIASTTAGIDLAVIQINCVQWDLSQTVANLRADARTAYLPIAFYGPEDVKESLVQLNRHFAAIFPDPASSIWEGTQPPGGVDPIERTTRMRLQRLIARSGPATFVAESGSATDFMEQIRPFIARIRGNQLTEEERSAQRTVALRWLAHLSQSEKGDVFDLASVESSLAELLDNPELAPRAIVALSGVPSNKVQERLAETAINVQTPPALRASAAHQVAFHIQKHGVMLTEDQVRNIYAAWKAEQDPVVVSAFATILGSLNPDAEAVGAQLGNLPAAR